MSDKRLPDFLHPPVNEVVCGVQFAPLEKFRAAHHGRFWQRVLSRYPETAEHPPISHVVERPEPSPSTKHEIATFEPLLVPRCWFLSQDKLRLIQVQPDRFLRNWRQIQGDEAYPRFSELFPEFLAEWQEFNSFLTDEGIGQPGVDQCELTYINHIPQGSGWSNMGEIHKVFRPFQKRPASSFLPGPDTFGWKSSVPLPDYKGRLHMQIKHGVRNQDRVPLLVLDLTARGAPPGKTQKDIELWFAIAHEWVVRGFEDLTTPAMHSIWNKV